MIGEFIIEFSRNAGAALNTAAVYLSFVFSVLGRLLNTIGRIALNSLESFLRGFLTMTYLSVWDFDEIFKPYSLKKDDRSKPETYGFGLLGLIPGLVIGILGFLPIIFFRIVLESLRNIRSFASSGRKLICAEEKVQQTPEKIQESPEKIQESTNDLKIRQYGLGFLGIFPLGPIFYLLGMGLGILERSFIECMKSANSAFVVIVDYGWKLLSDEEDPLLKAIDRLEMEKAMQEGEPKPRTYPELFMGFPGFLLGVLGGSLACVNLLFLNAILQSWESLKQTMVSVTKCGSDEGAEPLSTQEFIGKEYVKGGSNEFPVGSYPKNENCWSSLFFGKAPKQKLTSNLELDQKDSSLNLG